MNEGRKGAQQTNKQTYGSEGKFTNWGIGHTPNTRCAETKIGKQTECVHLKMGSGWVVGLKEGWVFRVGFFGLFFENNLVLKEMEEGAWRNGSCCFELQKCHNRVFFAL